MWISFDRVPKADALEFVRGSHRATLFNTSAFDPTDETAPLYEGLPRLGVAPMVEGLHERLAPGAPFRHEAFPDLTATNR